MSQDILEFLCTVYCLYYPSPNVMLFRAVPEFNSLFCKSYIFFIQHGAYMRKYAAWPSLSEHRAECWLPFFGHVAVNFVLWVALSASHALSPRRRMHRLWMRGQQRLRLIKERTPIWRP